MVEVTEVEDLRAFVRHIYLVLDQRRKMEPDNALRMDLEMLMQEIREELAK